MGLNFERENAREWQEDRGPISDSSDHESLNDDLVEYDDYHTNEAPDEDSESNWQQVTNKKQSAKQRAGPKTQFSIKNAPNRFSGRVRPPPPTPRSKAPPNRGSPTLLQRSKVPPNRGSRPLAPLRRAPTSQRQQPSQGLASLPLDKSRPAPIQRFRQVKKITFSTKNDNPAKAAFRAELPHAGTFVLSRPCYLIERDRTKLYAMFEEMGVRLGSFIRPPQHLMDKTLLLWGDTRQVEATKQELQHLIRQAELISPSPAKTDHFAKSNDVAEPMANSLDKKIKRDATRQIYQKAPDPNLKFNSIGTFIWPVEEVRPDELLGPSYEAFDPLRMLHQVYIVFNNPLGVFNIMSDNDKAVRDVIARIIGTIKEFAARSTREITALMVEPPSVSDMRKDIKLVAGKNMDTACIPVLTGTNLSTKEMMSWEKTCNEMTDAHFVRIRNALRRALPQLRYYRGRVQMRVLLGTFALKTFRRWPEGVTSIPFEKFLDNIKVPATKGQMIKDLQMKSDAQTLLAHIHSSNHVFEPVDSLTTALDEVIPTYSCRFDFDIPGTGKVQLEVELGKAGVQGLYEATHKQWTRKVDKSEAFDPLEMFMIRVQGGLSWELQITAANNVDATRITPQMSNFVQKVRPNFPALAGKREMSGQRVFNYVPVIPVIKFEQKTALRYRLVKDASWVFELSRYDSFRSPSANIPESTHWGAMFWNSEWDHYLGQNADLEIGKAARYEPSLTTFFPKGFTTASTGSDSGLKDFLLNMKAVVELLDQLKEKQ